MRGVPGTRCTLRCYGWGEGAPVEGDFLRTLRGACYRIDEVIACRPGSVAAFVLRCTRLERDAVQFGQPGVHGWVWQKRAPAEAGCRA